MDPAHESNTDQSNTNHLSLPSILGLSIESANASSGSIRVERTRN
jgi:hypothetical protein